MLYKVLSLLLLLRMLCFLLTKSCYNVIDVFAKCLIQKKQTLKSIYRLFNIKTVNWLIRVWSKKKMNWSDSKTKRLPCDVRNTSLELEAVNEVHYLSKESMRIIHSGKMF